MKSPRPPYSLAYFAEVVRSAWAADVARRAALSTPVPAALAVLPSSPRRGMTWDDYDRAVAERRTSTPPSVEALRA
jgi:hypothetical protein